MSQGVANASTPKSSLLSRLADNEKLIAYLFILPSVVGFILFYAYPAIRSVFISFTEWNLLTDAKFVGLDNYNEIFADERFWRSLEATVWYVLWNIPIQTVIALFMAVVLDRFSDAISNLMRSVMILPWLLPNVIVALLWLWILDPSIGIANVLLNIVGVPKQDFLGDPDQAIAWIAMINIWRYAGYNAILIFAGLKTIPKSLYEAAGIDGANLWTQFWKITLPLLRPVLTFVLVTSVIGSFQVYDTIAVTTQGGPAGATRVIIYYIMDEVFNRRISMGTATAASVVLFLILISVTIIQMRFLQADQSDLQDYS
ncbi:sugar ABC transporter permease [Phototrophicus methaneseepsis]|uniref:Sugar ABC transporter permease n=1 Tax=Phototrophicus methaneseepsis TaxID=2710758 RepID=A0A7S8IGE4_9CHLR|nr:sugar ABC transporter permease [Phototrophicus methaneseepsis]QPC84597.1 sugar ABC transporter permease [Phototrophicus methaneseepsis]